MKKRVSELILVAIVGAVIMISRSHEVNCEFCGEVFNNKHTILKEMCDVCFGWNEHKATMSENGIQVNFEDGTGYYFEGIKK